MALLGLGLAIDAAYATFKLHGQFAADDKLKREGTPKAYDVEKWRVLLVYDKDIAAVAEKLTPLGEKWGDQFARDFLALNDKRYLLDVVRKVIADARQSADLAERARRDWYT